MDNILSLIWSGSRKAKLCLSLELVTFSISDSQPPWQWFCHSKHLRIPAAIFSNPPKVSLSLFLNLQAALCISFLCHIEEK